MIENKNEEYIKKTGKPHPMWDEVSKIYEEEEEIEDTILLASGMRDLESLLRKEGGNN